MEIHIVRFAGDCTFHVFHFVAQGFLGIAGGDGFLMSVCVVGNDCRFSTWIVEELYIAFLKGNGAAFRLFGMQGKQHRCQFFLRIFQQNASAFIDTGWCILYLRQHFCRLRGEEPPYKG